MRERIITILTVIIVAFVMGGCTMHHHHKRAKYDRYKQEDVLRPESIEVYDVKVNNVWERVNNGRRLLRDFPFTRVRPVLDFKGKFSDQFYSKMDYRYKYSKLEDVDFWKLRVNPYAEDFIYVLPMWANKFKRVSDDLFKDIGYSYNLSKKEQEILKWWISQGGILWIEGGIYSTRYDTFKRNGEIDSKAIIDKISKKSKNLNFFDRRVKTYMYMSKKLDYVNYVPLEIDFKTKSDIAYFKDIRDLKIVTNNYLTADFMPRGKYLIKSERGKPLVSFIQYGRGGVVFLRPFEFIDKMYDGELLRWKLIYYLLNRMYEDKNKKTDGYKEIKEQLNGSKVIVTHNIHFAYDSYKILPESIKYIKMIAKYLKEYPNKRVEIQGHTDSIASRGYNYKLSLNRANSVKRELVKMGIASDRIKTVGYGEDRPIATNKSEEGRALNRRVEFHIQ